MVQQNAQEINYMLDFRSFVWPAQKIVMRGHGLLFFIPPPPRLAVIISFVLTVRKTGNEIVVASIHIFSFFYHFKVILISKVK